MKRLTAALWITLSCSAQAEFWDGNMLLERLTSTSVYERGTAMGYVMGVHDTMQGVNHCPSSNVQAGQVREMVLNYLTNVPARRHETGDVLVLHVLKTAFPCSNSRGGRNL